jgi:acetyl esterase/lipase
VPGLLRASRWAEYWKNEARTLGFNNEPRLLTGHALAFRRYLQRAVPDPVLRERLTPADPMGCKRILISNEWYPALQLPQVELCTDRVVEVREHSVVTADGTEREVDTIVLGTGFAATDFLVPMRVTGLGGRDLHEAWAGGARAYLGTAVPGFPSFFTLYGPNTNLGHNSILFMIEAQLGWVVQAVPAAAAGGGLGRRPGACGRGLRRVGAAAQPPDGVRGRLQQLVPHRRRPQHPELAGLDAHVPPPAAPPRPRRRPPAARGAGAGRGGGVRLPLGLVRAVVLAGTRPLGPPVPVRAQRAWLAAQSRLGRPPAGTRVEQVVLGGVRTERVTSAHGGTGPTVLWLHGGAFWTCSPRTHRVLAGHLAAATGGPVLVPDYRLAPEHPHPAALDDARAAYDALTADGPVVVGGDSAGGALALLLALALRDEGAAPPSSLLLVSPVVDLTGASSAGYRGQDVVLRPGWVRDGTAAFVAGHDAASLSPLRQPLHDLPPVLLQLSEHERLRPEGEALAAALRAASVPVDDEVLAGLWHDVHLQADLVPEGAEAVRRMGSWARARAS